MCRHLYFGHNVYVTLGGICYNFLYLLLSIESSVGCFFSRLLRRARVPWLILTVDTPCAYFRQAGIFFYFYSPPLVVDKMPVKDIHLMHGEDIYVPLDKVNIKKMPAYVEVHSSPGKPRVVCNRYAGHCPLKSVDDSTALYPRREKLPDCLQPPRQTCRSTSGKSDFLSINCQKISLRVYFKSGGDDKIDVAVSAFLSLKGKASRRTQHFSKKTGHISGPFTTCVIYFSRRAQGEVPLSRFHFYRLRDDCRQGSLLVNA